MNNPEINTKRKLPRHVEGRIMLGQLPLKNFFMMLPIAAIIITVVIIFLSKLSVFIGVVLLGIILLLFTELANNETGGSILKGMFKYLIRGDYDFERINYGKPTYKRFTRNKIEK